MLHKTFYLDGVLHLRDDFDDILLVEGRALCAVDEGVVAEFDEPGHALVHVVGGGDDAAAGVGRDGRLEGEVDRPYRVQDDRAVSRQHFQLVLGDDVAEVLQSYSYLQKTCKKTVRYTKM